MPSSAASVHPGFWCWRRAHSSRQTPPRVFPACLTAGLVAVPLWGLANWFRLAVPVAWAWALGLHLFSWFAQIVFGHQMAEHRRPALLDSFFQVSVAAAERVGASCWCCCRCRCWR